MLRFHKDISTWSDLRSATGVQGGDGENMCENEDEAVKRTSGWPWPAVYAVY